MEPLPRGSTHTLCLGRHAPGTAPSATRPHTLRLVSAAVDPRCAGGVTAQSTGGLALLERTSGVPARDSSGAAVTDTLSLCWPRESNTPPPRP